MQESARESFFRMRLKLNVCVRDYYWTDGKDLGSLCWLKFQAEEEYAFSLSNFYMADTFPTY
jgi:hypothetical protein